MTIAQDKARLRPAAKAARRNIAARVPNAGEMLRDCLLENLDGLGIEAGAVVAAFWPVGDEVDTRPTLAALDAAGYRCVLPVVQGRGKPLLFRRWTPQTILQPAGFGLLEPPESAAEAVPRLVLVPLLIFDGAGYRLGHGAGYYDRTLAKLRAAGDSVAVGLAFAGQEVAAVPHEAHDERLDAVVTEMGMRRIESRNR